MISHVLPITCIAPQFIKDRNDIEAVIRFLIQIIGIKDFDPFAQGSFREFQNPDGTRIFDDYQANAGDKIIQRIMELCNELGENLNEITDGVKYGEDCSQVIKALSAIKKRAWRDGLESHSELSAYLDAIHKTASEALT